MLSTPYAIRLDTALERTRLFSAYDYVVLNNPANDLPYHNLHHTQCMVLTCIAAADSAHFSESARRALFLAALFHDYDHSGGVALDSVNIVRAVTALRDAARVLGLPPELAERSAALIESTHYPYIREALNEAERILRDGDMCQLLYDDWHPMIFEGMRAEMAHRQGPSTDSEFMAAQERFYSGVVLHSRWGRAYQKKFDVAARDCLRQAANRLALLA